VSTLGGNGLSPVFCWYTGEFVKLGAYVHAPSGIHTRDFWVVPGPARFRVTPDRAHSRTTPDRARPRMTAYCPLLGMTPERAHIRVTEFAPILIATPDRAHLMMTPHRNLFGMTPDRAHLRVTPDLTRLKSGSRQCPFLKERSLSWISSILYPKEFLGSPNLLFYGNLGLFLWE
jgi:hypothetical protein